MRLLFVSEKRSVIDAVKRTYALHKKELEYKVGNIDFFELPEKTIKYMPPTEYPNWGALYPNKKLPMIPEEFILSVSTDEHAVKALKNFRIRIAKTHYDALVCGTEPDIYGNGMFYDLVRHEHLVEMKTFRFFTSSLAEDSVHKALLCMTDFYRNGRDIRMTEAYLVSSEFDWNIKTTSSAMMALKSQGKYNSPSPIERVMSPAIRLICDDKNHSAEPAERYIIKATFLEGFSGILVDKNGSEKTFGSREEAENTLKNIDGLDAVIERIERKKERICPPPLHTLTTIQKEAETELAYTPWETLDLLVALHDKGYVSYPFTECHFITKKTAKNIGAFLKASYIVPELRDYIKSLTQEKVDSLKTNKLMVDDEQVEKSLHGAIVPTENAPKSDKLSEKEWNIYRFICKRLVLQSLDLQSKTKTTLHIRFSGFAFKSEMYSVTKEGWTSLYKSNKQSKTIYPNLQEGSLTLVMDRKIHEQPIRQQKKLTSAALIEQIESLSKQDNEDIVGKHICIGNPHSRTKAVKRLVEMGYASISKDDNSLCISKKGTNYVNVLKDVSITSPIQVSALEGVIKDVSNGRLSYKTAKKKTNAYIIKLLKELSVLNAEQVLSLMDNEELKCPYCGSRIIRSEYGVQCEKNKKRQCRFFIFDKEHLLKKSDISGLIEKGETGKIKNIVYSNKTGERYDAKLKLLSEDSKKVIEYIFC